MRLVLLAGWLALTGCDAFLRFQHVSAVDAPPRPDSDGGGCTPSLDDTMDEDCDGSQDVMDLCPADVSLTDIDTDGVGDLCDPDNTVHDSVVMFDGFPSLDPRWQAVTGSWAISGGMLDNNNTDAFITRPQAMSAFLVETYVFWQALGSNPLFVIAVLDAAGATQYECNVAPNSSGVIVQAVESTSAGTNNGGPSVPLTGSGKLRVQLVENVAANEIECRVSYSTTIGTKATLTVTGPLIDGANVIMRASASHVLIDSVTAVSK